MQTEPFPTTTTNTIGELSRDAQLLLTRTLTNNEQKQAWLSEIARDEEIARYLAIFMGCAVKELEVPFGCVLGHPDCMARLTKGRNGVIVYTDSTLADTHAKPEFLTLPEVRAAQLDGVPRRLGKQQHRYGVRLLHEAGLLPFPSIGIPDLPPESLAQTVRGRRGVELLFGCHWFFFPGDPVMCSTSFLQSWCGFSESEAKMVLRALVYERIIIVVGEKPSGYGHPAYTYLPYSDTARLLHEKFEQSRTEAAIQWN